jgi:hypothetical protein
MAEAIFKTGFEAKAPAGQTLRYFILNALPVFRIDCASEVHRKTVLCVQDAQIIFKQRVI